ncbi:MAG: hypothetical protein HY268_17130 [Deltaproteobacteria bacterium]|nr:hypothetical protein [Deltaproteobacteria bacterium]
MKRVVLLIAANLLITLLLLEIGLRLFPRLIPHQLLFYFEPVLRGQLAEGRFPTINDTVALDRDDGGFPLRIWKPFARVRHNYKDPGTVEIVTMDQFGFCNPPESANARAPIDIISIGDSLTWCTTVDPKDTWTAKLSDLSHLSTYNLGMGGVGLYEYLQIYKRYGRPRAPKLVIMNVAETNDLRDAVRYQDYRKHLGEKDSTQPQRSISLGAIYRDSYVVNLLWSTATYLKMSRADEPNFRYQLVFPEGAVPFNLQNHDTDEVENARKLVGGELYMDVLGEAIEEFARLAKQDSFTPVLSYTPSAYTAYASQVAFEDATLKTVLPRFSQEQRAYYKAKSQELGITFVDLTPALQAVAPKYNTPERLLYFQSDLHLTQFGHQVVAEKLRDVVSTLVR